MLGDNTEEVVTTPFLEKKLSTKYVDKGTDELKNMKKAVVTILRKFLDKLEGKSKGYTGWFKLDSGFFFFNLQFIHNSIKNLKVIFRIKTCNCIQRLLYRLIKNLSR